jgi:hypothetical protein
VGGGGPLFNPNGRARYSYGIVSFERRT